MTDERLKRLSQVKEQREDRARNALQRQLAMLAEAQYAVLQAAGEEQAFREASERRRVELYVSALGKSLSIHRLERINLQIAEMERQISLLQQALETAQARCREAGQAVEGARKELAARHRENQKWTRLTERVEEKARRATELAAELELGDELADRRAKAHDGAPSLDGADD